MLNYETLLSSYDDKLTLMQWLKKVEAALKDASAVSFNVNKKGDATLTFSIVFEDGSEIESGEIVLQQGESVASGAIVNGHLILTLTNGDEIDAGSLFNGNIDIAGNLRVQGDIDCEGKISGDEIVENMTGYTFTAPASTANFDVSVLYAGVVKNGNKLTFALLLLIEKLTSTNVAITASFTIPSDVMAKLIPYRIVNSDYLDNRTTEATQKSDYQRKTLGLDVTKNTKINFIVYTSALTENEPTYARIEETFLLSENLAA